MGDGNDGYRRYIDTFNDERRHAYHFDKHREAPDLEKMTPRQLRDYQSYVIGMGNHIDVHGRSIHSWFRDEVERVASFLLETQKPKGSKE